MGGFFVLFLLLAILSFVVPLAVMGNDRARRARADYGGPRPATPAAPSPTSALANWDAPGDEEAAAGPAGPRVGGRPLTCGHCGSVDFEEREAQLNTAMATFFNVDWANRTATCFVCLRCGHIEWFLL